MLIVIIIIFQVNDLFVRDYDCCQVRPLFLQADNVLLTVSRNALANGNGAAAKSLPIPDSLQVYASSVTEDEMY